MKKVLSVFFVLLLMFAIIVSFNQTAEASAKPKISNIKVTSSAIIQEESISIKFKVNTKCTTYVQIYDKNNKLVKKLSSKTTQKNKTASFKWDGKNSKGKYVAAGKYKIKMYAGKTTATKYTNFKNSPPPTPIVYSGTGDQVISNVNLTSKFYRAKITHNGSSNFAIKDYYGSTWDLLVNEIGNYNGTVLMHEAVTHTLNIKADGAWSIEILLVASGSANTFFRER